MKANLSAFSNICKFDIFSGTFESCNRCKWYKVRKVSVLGIHFGARIRSTDAQTYRTNMKLDATTVLLGSYIRVHKGNAYVVLKRFSKLLALSRSVVRNIYFNNHSPSIRNLINLTTLQYEFIRLQNQRTNKPPDVIIADLRLDHLRT